MIKKTRKFATLAQACVFAVTAASALYGGIAMAQSWPSRPISLIVPFPAGGTTDVLARAVGHKPPANR